MEAPQYEEKIKKLTKKEVMVLYLVCTGLQYKEIGLQMNLGVEMVTKYMGRVYEKLEFDLSAHSTKRRPKLKPYCEVISKLLEEVKEQGKSWPPEDDNPQPSDLALRAAVQDEIVIYEKPSGEIIEIPQPDPPPPKPPIILYIVIIVLLGVIVYLLWRITALPSVTVITTQVITAVSQPVFTLPPATLQPTFAPLPTYTLYPTQVQPTVPPLPTSTPQNILFQDSFDNGLDSGWQVLSGEPYLVNGYLTADKDTWLTVGDSSWKNYQINMEAQGKDCWFSSSYNVIGFRAKDKNNMIAFKWANCEYEWDVVSGGSWTTVPTTHITGNWWGVLPFSILAEKDKFSIDVSDQFSSSMTKIGYETGKVVLKVAPGSKIYNFKVEPLP